MILKPKLKTWAGLFFQSIPLRGFLGNRYTFADGVWYVEGLQWSLTLLVEFLRCITTIHNNLIQKKCHVMITTNDNPGLQNAPLKAFYDDWENPGLQNAPLKVFYDDWQNPGLQNAP